MYLIQIVIFTVIHVWMWLKHLSVWQHQTICGNTSPCGLCTHDEIIKDGMDAIRPFEKCFVAGGNAACTIIPRLNDHLITGLDAPTVTFNQRRESELASKRQASHWTAKPPAWLMHCNPSPVCSGQQRRNGNEQHDTAGLVHGPTRRLYSVMPNRELQNSNKHEPSI